MVRAVVTGRIYLLFGDPGRVRGGAGVMGSFRMALSISVPPYIEPR